MKLVQFWIPLLVGSLFFACSGERSEQPSGGAKAQNVDSFPPTSSVSSDNLERWRACKWIITAPADGISTHFMESPTSFPKTVGKGAIFEKRLEATTPLSGSYQLRFKLLDQRRLAASEVLDTCLEGAKIVMGMSLAKDTNFSMKEAPPCILPAGFYELESFGLVDELSLFPTTAGVKLTKLVQNCGKTEGSINLEGVVYGEHYFGPKSPGLKELGNINTALNDPTKNRCTSDGVGIYIDGYPAYAPQTNEIASTLQKLQNAGACTAKDTIRCKVNAAYLYLDGRFTGKAVSVDQYINLVESKLCRPNAGPRCFVKEGLLFVDGIQLLSSSLDFEWSDLVRLQNEGLCETGAAPKCRMVSGDLFVNGENKGHFEDKDRVEALIAAKKSGVCD